MEVKHVNIKKKTGLVRKHKNVWREESKLTKIK